jgi:hypothetical protein
LQIDASESECPAESKLGNDIVEPYMCGAGCVERVLLAAEVGGIPGKHVIRGPALEEDIDNDEVSEAWAPPTDPSDPSRFTGEIPRLLPILLPLPIEEPIEFREAHRTVSNTFL